MLSLNSWKNSRGQVVVEHATGLMVLPNGWTLEQWEKRERGRLAAQAEQRQVAEIDTALKDTGCVALLNDETGSVQTFLLPNSEAARTDDELASLKREAKRLQAIIDDLRISKPERMLAGERLNEVNKRIESLTAARARTKTVM